MSKPPTFAELTDPDAAGEKEEGYDEWLRERVREAIEHDKAHPEQRRTIEEVRAHLAERLKTFS